MAKPRKSPTKPAADNNLLRRLSSSDNSPFSPSNRPSMFVGVVIGMSVMGIVMRAKEFVEPTANTILLATDSNNNQAIRKGNTNNNNKRQHPQFDPSWDIFQRIEAEQTGRVRGPSKQAPITGRKVNFLQHDQLSEPDGFSASWLQTRESFMAMDIDGINICEDAAFFAYSSRRHREQNWKMTSDWLDFAVEHMSKWYQMMGVFMNDIPFDNAVKKLEDYLERASQYPVAEEPVFQQAIAVIAFMPIDEKDHADKVKHLSVRTLAATVESLRRAGFGRVVVVGMQDDDRIMVEEAFSLVRQKVGGSQRSGHMEIGFVQGHSGHAKTEHQEINVPKAALMGLRDAFSLQQQGASDNVAVHFIKKWLGEHDLGHWNMVYLTEPDSILATRPSTLRALKQNVENGAVLIPWRLQPIPHESDVQGARETWRYLKAQGDFANVMELDALDVNAGKCCDEYKGPDFKPGRPPNFPECDNFWYRCGFHQTKENDPNAHERLRPYKLIKLKHGTQMVHLASHEHGRRCAPEQVTVFSENAGTDVCGPPLN